MNEKYKFNGNFFFCSFPANTVETKKELNCIIKFRLVSDTGTLLLSEKMFF